MLHVQFVPVALPGVRPVGNVSATVTVVPSVATPPVFATAKVKLPVEPRTKVAAVAVFVIVRLTGSTVLTVTAPLADVVSPPPTTLAVFVREALAFEATVTNCNSFLRQRVPTLADSLDRLVPK